MCVQGVWPDPEIGDATAGRQKLGTFTTTVDSVGACVVRRLTNNSEASLVCMNATKKSKFIKNLK